MTNKSGAWCRLRGANLHLQGWAKSEFHKALRRGTLVRQACEVCGKEGTEGHHEDYAEPTQVIWLCRFHHAQRHQGTSVEEMKTWPGVAA